MWCNTMVFMDVHAAYKKVGTKHWTVFCYCLLLCQVKQSGQEVVEEFILSLTYPKTRLAQLGQIKKPVNMQNRPIWKVLRYVLNTHGVFYGT